MNFNLSQNVNRFLQVGYLLVIFGFLWWLVLPVLGLHAEHLRVVEVFNVDEADFLWPLHLCMKEGNFEINRADYGLLHYNIGLLVTKTFGLFSEVTDTVIIKTF